MEENQEAILKGLNIVLHRMKRTFLHLRAWWNLTKRVEAGCATRHANVRTRDLGIRRAHVTLVVQNAL